MEVEYDAVREELMVAYLRQSESFIDYYDTVEPQDMHGNYYFKNPLTIVKLLVRYDIDKSRFWFGEYEGLWNLYNKKKKEKEYWTGLIHDAVLGDTDEDVRLEDMEELMRNSLEESESLSQYYQLFPNESIYDYYRDRTQIAYVLVRYDIDKEDDWFEGDADLLQKKKEEEEEWAGLIHDAVLGDKDVRLRL